MKKPEMKDKKYTYYHKKLGKKMFNNELYGKDIKTWNELNEKQNNK